MTRRTAASSGTVRGMSPQWPDHGEEPDPALAPLIEAGEGEAEGFDVAESDLIEHA